MEHIKKLAAVRESMAERGIDAYIIPSADPHISEYLPDRFKAIAWTSGFTGSAGTLVITQNFAGLWTDARYFVQGREQLTDTGFELVKLKVQHKAEYVEWLGEKFGKGNTVAFDGNLTSLLLAKTVKEKLEPLGIVVNGSEDLLDAAWEDRPLLPTDSAYLIHPDTTGQDATSKIAAIRLKMEKLHTQAHIISSLDDLAWTLNIRGNDVPCNPVVLGFLIIELQRATLFIDRTKLSAEDQAELNRAGVDIQPYDSVHAYIQQLAVEQLLIDPKRTCYAVYESIPAHVTVLEDTNPSTFLKAVKNPTEVSFTRETMLKDGVALTRFFKWLEENVGHESLTEISIADQLQAFRAAQDGFVDISFDTIAGYLEHGALPHYKATPKSDATLKASGLLLVDSGGQYTSGTTDITRVVSLGNITQVEQEDYTIVLKGLIEGSMAIFPQGTRGYQVDAITRRPIWETLRNYGHGTGHGVGFFLNVHEGPHVLNPSNVDVAIEEGMISSIEPGLYREGSYGIRIENLVLSRALSHNEFGDFMDFETLTICYIATDLVNKSLLDTKHIEWLNEYNNWAYNQLAPLLTAEEGDWLKEKTQAI
ncbi:aminopeptidase P family protein [Sphingobacterium sp. lm-10]|uniref:aminopeptidase P family protein n=1 Tax=Sphingobacterium sp. lm-10 TaxID=2944904 RepID=UPI002021FD87|nr:aminopeptidase P family protein [Sphingobacterium sp. lm-10]MCL7989366.1 aminopeptidase P family protein [Sphingobacterium sp. lm-10]